ncbi:MAG: WecB/TagA/CpsF family glycosyltransferase [Oscillospiraceae bacterium]|nr:WecB/TagA/CpsF family glycosyltransferase [Oscillospiraceae bacterium]
MDMRYIKKRDFSVCDTVSVCATTLSECVGQIFDLPVEPVSATVDLIGVPAVVSASKDPKIKEMYSKATMAIIDGMPIVRKGRKLGFSCDRCAAPDIMGPIFAESVKRGKTHYFYGGKDDEVLEKLRTNLERDYPGIKIVGMYSPPFRPLTEEEDEKICNEINELKPDFCWVGIGAPKQEMWMWEHQEKIHGTRMLGVGAGFNFFAGTLDKAPAWVENASLEWLFRLTKEPKRLWKRYILGGFTYLKLSIGHPSRKLR